MSKKNINLTNQSVQEHAQVHVEEHLNYVTDEEFENGLSSKAELGETTSTAYRGDRGKIAYDHSQAAHAPSNAQKNSDITKAEIEAKLTGTITSHNHDDKYYTESEVDSKLSTTLNNAKGYVDTQITNLIDSAPDAMNTLNELAGAINEHQDVYEAYVTQMTNNLNNKADKNHGNHVPATETANNAKFLRNDNTWATVTPANIGASESSHTHNYAGSSSVGGAANSVANNLSIKLNGGGVEGTSLFTFNGSNPKTVNITPAGIGAAAASHGNHVPAIEAANNAKFLRNDNTWATVTPANIGAAAASHGTHLTLGTTSSTAFRGDYGNTAYTHSQAAHAPSNAQKNSDITKAEIEAKLTGAITTHTHSYLPLAGGSVSGAITSTVGGGKAGFIITNGTSRTMMYASSNVGEHIFGGCNDGSEQVKDFIRIGTNKLTYETSGATYNIYHAGNKPSASDIGAAPTSHASTATTYGVSSASNYGHAMASGTTPKANGTAAVGSETAKFARGDHVHPLQTTVSGNAGSATKLATARNIVIGNKTNSFNGSADITYTLNDIGATETVAWDTSIKCATWSRLFQFASNNATTGGTFLVNIRATRSSVVYNPTLLVNFSHASVCSIVQINNTSYSNIKVRGVVDTNGAGYFEIYDNVNSATNSTTQTVSVTVTEISSGLNITKYTAFTDGTSIPTNYASKGEITTVSGTYYSGTSAKANTAATWQTSRTLTIGNTGKAVNGSADVSWSLAEIGAIPLTGNTGAYSITGNLEFSDAGTGGGFKGVVGKCGNNDYWRVGGLGMGSNDGRMEIATSDDGNEPIYVRQYTGVYSTLVRTATLLDTNGNTSFPGSVTVGDKAQLKYNATSESLDFIFV